MTNDNYERYYKNNEPCGDRMQEQQYPTEYPQYGYRQEPYYTDRSTRPAPEMENPYLNSSSAKPEKKHGRKKSSRKPTGAVAAALAVCVLCSGAAGFGGSYLFSKFNDSSDGSSNQTGAVNVGSIINASAQLTDKSTNEIVAEVADSVVEITTEIVQSNSFYGNYTAQAAGSGVIISEDGYILTNNHVIEDASKITVTLRSGESYDAKLIGTDADLDIALIKIEASGLTAAGLGDSSTVNVGDKSVIIGNPLGTLGGSVTEGIVSAVDRALEIEGKTMHLMQTDAAVNPGNSGGGMFNGQGELVGIVVAKSSDTSSGSTIDNIGFVIPINSAINILDDLRQYGYVRGKASTGMAYSEGGNQMYAQYFGYGGMSDAGVYIASVTPGSNAAEAGFSAGDRVISVDGEAVNSFSDLKRIISEHSAGDKVSFEIERSGRTGTIELTLEEYAPSTSA